MLAKHAQSAQQVCGTSDRAFASKLPCADALWLASLGYLDALRAIER